MTDHITRLKEALEAGPTEGPWVSQQDDDSDFECVGPVGPHGLVSAPVVKLHSTADAAFIAAANPAAIRELLERLGQAEETSKLWELRFETLHALYQYRPATQELDTAIKAATNRQGEQQ